MPTHARERLAGLMLDALDFGGGGNKTGKKTTAAGRKEPIPKPKLKENRDLARGRAYGITDAGMQVAADLKDLVEQILLHQKGEEDYVQKRDDQGNPVTDIHGNAVFENEKRHKTVDEMLRDWRKNATKTPEDGRASVAEYAKRMSQNDKRTDYESRVLSLYKALDGPKHEGDVSRDKVKRTKKPRDVMDIDVLLNLYKRARAALRLISEKGKHAEENVKNKNTKRGKNKLSELQQEKRSLQETFNQMPKLKA